MIRDAPALTVVVVVGDIRGRLAQTMESIFHQEVIDRIEVLVVDCGDPDAPPIPHHDHPSVRVITMPRSTTLPQARGEGVRQARAPLVAFLDEHSFAFAGWASALIQAHEGPWAGVGGEIYNMTSGVGLSDPIYLMGHGRWIPPVQRGPVKLLPSHDTCYKREILLRYGEELDDLLMAEPVLMWKLQADGYQLFLEPTVKSAHGYTVNPKTLVAFYAWSRGLGHMRAKVFNWPWWRRALFVLNAPLLPWARAASLLNYLVRNRPDTLWTFFVGWPFIVLAQHGAAVGEALGVLCGLGRTQALFAQSHLRGLRWHVENL
jgi:glycosyltransferase involved in cell wall biosynthesis